MPRIEIEKKDKVKKKNSIANANSIISTKDTDSAKMTRVLHCFTQYSTQKNS